MTMLLQILLNQNRFNGFWFVWCKQKTDGGSNFNRRSEGMCGLFTKLALSSLECVVSNDGAIDDRWIGNDLKRSGCGLIEILSGIYLEGLRNTTKMLSQDSRWPCRNSKERLPNICPERERYANLFRCNVVYAITSPISFINPFRRSYKLIKHTRARHINNAKYQRRNSQMYNI
jgi:hypothetical protein